MDEGDPGCSVEKTEYRVGSFRLCDLMQDADVKNFVSYKGSNLKFVPFEKKTKEIVMAAVRQDGYSILFAPPHLGDDVDIIREAVKTYSAALLRCNSANGLIFCRDIVMSAIRQSASLYSLLLPPLREDEEVVRLVLTSEPRYIHLVPYSFCESKEIAFIVLSQRGELLEYFSRDIQDDEECLRVAMESDPAAFRFASVRLQSNKETVWYAVGKLGLNYASVRCLNLRGCRSLCEFALQQNGIVYLHLPPGLREDRDIVLRTLSSRGNMLKNLPGSFLEDREAVLIAVESYGYALSMLPSCSDFLNDKEIVLKAVKQRGSALRYASLRLKNDLDVCLAAVQQAGKNIKFVGSDATKDKRIFLTAGMTFDHTTKFVHSSLIGNEFLILGLSCLRTENWSPLFHRIQREAHYLLLDGSFHASHNPFSSMGMRLLLQLKQVNDDALNACFNDLWAVPISPRTMNTDEICDHHIDLIDTLGVISSFCNSEFASRFMEVTVQELASPESLIFRKDVAHFLTMNPTSCSQKMSNNCPLGYHSL